LRVQQNEDEGIETYYICVRTHTGTRVHPVKGGTIGTELLLPGYY
jgi:hypothetical protein